MRNNLLLILLLATFVLNAQYSQTGGTVSTIANGTSWSNLSNALSSDNAYASTTINSSNTQSDYLVVTNFGFSVPTNETVTGVEVVIEKSRNNLFTFVNDLDVRLVQAGSLTGVSRAYGGGYPIFDLNYTYGSNIDLWGLGLTPSDINNSGFGVAIASNYIFGFGGTSVFIDAVTINVTTQAPLPVELTAFDGKQVDDNVELTWTTNSEINNNYFEIQKSTDGFVFQAIGQVSGHGNSSSIHNYTFTDESTRSGKYYYRLKQIDFDGTFAYSDIIVVESKLKSEIIFYPNPATTAVKFKNVKASEFTAKVYGVSGELLLEETLDSHKFLNVSFLESGYYILETTEEGVLSRSQLIIK